MQLMLAKIHPEACIQRKEILMKKRRNRKFYFLQNVFDGLKIAIILL